MLKKIMCISVVAILGCFTFLSPIQTQASWTDGQYQWVGAYRCNQDRFNVGACWLIDSNINYDRASYLSRIFKPAKYLKSIAGLNRSISCRNNAKAMWNQYANYGEPGNYSEVKCWNKRW